MKTKIAIFISIVTLVMMTYVGKEGYLTAKAYEKVTLELSEQMHASDIVEYKLKELANLLTLGVMKNSKKEHIATLNKYRDKLKKDSDRYAIYFALLAVVILLTYFLLSLRGFTIVVSLASIIALLNGLITPIMLVLLHKDIDYLGDIVLSFESKGIIGSIEKIYTQGSIMLAFAILLFSIIIPIIKTTSLLFVSLFENSPFASKIVHFFKHLGKWSMIDVFVVAVLLVYMTTGDSDVSRAEVEIGLYMFMTYVILSMVASISADKMLQMLKTE